MYTKDEFKKQLLEAGTYGLPVRLAYNALNQFSEMDTLALNFLEIDCLGLDKKFVPMMSSHTQSATSDEEGRPKGDATDESEASAEKRDTAKG